MIAKDYVPPWARGDFDQWQFVGYRSITPFAQQGAVRRKSFPVAGAFDGDLVAGVGQAFEGAVAEDGVVKEAQTFIHGPVAGDDEAGHPMAFSASSLATDAGSSTTSPARSVRRRWAAVLGCPCGLVDLGGAVHAEKCRSVGRR